MGEMVAGKLRDAGLGGLAVTHRTPSRAEPLARTLDANVVPFESLDEALTTADVVITCAGLGTYTLSHDAVDAALRRRRHRPVFIIDLAVPRDTDPAIDRLDGAFLYDSTDLEGVARAGLAEREAVADEAWRIIDERLEAYARSRAMRARAPAIDALRRRFEVLRQEVLADAGDNDAEAATRLLVKRLLHDPSKILRGLAADDEDAERILRRLFRLDDNEETET
jgi:glutamyl-tRNA reductase